MQEYCYHLDTIGLKKVQLVIYHSHAYFCSDTFYAPFGLADLASMFMVSDYCFDFIFEGEKLFQVSDKQLSQIMQIVEKHRNEEAETV